MDNKETDKSQMNGSMKDMDDYADIISVQSFSNTGRKKPLVWAAFEERPLLTKEGTAIIASALEADRI